MNDSLKSIIRHTLTAIGVLLSFIGLDKFVGVVDFVSQNLDTVWNSLIVLVGFVTTLYGFFFKRPEVTP